MKPNSEIRYEHGNPELRRELNYPKKVIFVNLDWYALNTDGEIFKVRHRDESKLGNSWPIIREIERNREPELYRELYSLF